jgi:hypothetical protein
MNRPGAEPSRRVGHEPTPSTGITQRRPSRADGQPVGLLPTHRHRWLEEMVLIRPSALADGTGSASVKHAAPPCLVRPSRCALHAQM